MNARPPLKVHRLSKDFRIYADPADRAKDWILPGRPRRFKMFRALDDVSFDLRPGEVFGVLGKNGAGKSTLLKILTGTMPASGGSFSLSGRIVSLLELGTGFDPALTGRRNLAHSAELMGFPPRYLKERLADIEAFAELGEFFDRPLQTYSSGMISRLSFALVVFLECDVLILDEVLAVGDVYFQRKCFHRLKALKEKGTAVVLVTHNLTVVNEFCDRALVLEGGKVSFLGGAGDAIREYMRRERIDSTSPARGPVPLKRISTVDAESLSWPRERAFRAPPEEEKRPGGKARCVRLALCGEDANPCAVFQQGDWAALFVEYQLTGGAGPLVAQVSLANSRDLLVMAKSTLMDHGPEVRIQGKPGDLIRVKQSIKCDLLPGDYILSVFLKEMDEPDFERALLLDHESIERLQRPIAGASRAAHFSVTLRRNGMSLRHHGVCNLPGESAAAVIFAPDEKLLPK